MPASGAATGPRVALLLVTDRKTEAKVLGKLVLRVEPVSEVDAAHAAVGVYLQYTHQRRLALHFDYSHVVSWVLCRSRRNSALIASTEQGRSREFLSRAGPNIFHYDSTSARNHSNRGVPPLAAPPSRIARRPFFKNF